ncbi:uncharacterized protein [Clytia hemisphaerica]|uniref:uncharacterized protein n=1 Tax=Clytia hemisphaerica TaxID=252671 RepID=UPI0034D6F9C0
MKFSSKNKVLLVAIILLFWSQICHTLKCYVDHDKKLLHECLTAEKCGIEKLLLSFGIAISTPICVSEQMVNKCGQSLSKGHTSATLCCCDEGNCNDAKFSESCKPKTPPTTAVIPNSTPTPTPTPTQPPIQPDSFTCMHNVRVEGAGQLDFGETICDDTLHIKACSVNVLRAGDIILVTSQCVAKDDSDDCINNSNDITTGVCCCTTKDCNDVDFIQQCKSGIVAPTNNPINPTNNAILQTGIIKPLNPSHKPETTEDFYCHDKVVLNGEIVRDRGLYRCNEDGDEHLDKCTFAHGTDWKGGKVTYQGCLPTTAANHCNSKFYYAGAEVTACCCETSNCNDDVFIAKCSGSYVIRSNNIFQAATLLIVIFIVN